MAMILEEVRTGPSGHDFAADRGIDARCRDCEVPWSVYVASLLRDGATITCHPIYRPDPAAATHFYTAAALAEGYCRLELPPAANGRPGGSVVLPGEFGAVLIAEREGHPYELELEPCECEHVSHFDGGPSHPYGERRAEVERMSPSYRICRACRESHWRSLP